MSGVTGRFGPIGEDVAWAAGELLGALEGEVPPHQADDDMVLDRHDRNNLNMWTEIVTDLPMIDVPAARHAEKTALHSWVTIFHTSMPFTEAERDWLTNVAMKDTDVAKEVPTVIAHKTDEIMSAGVLQPVNGRELMRRWAAWRRGTDEFVGQGSLEMACVALRGLRHLLA
jgi:hypothetical protein